MNVKTTLCSKKNKKIKSLFKRDTCGKDLTKCIKMVGYEPVYKVGNPKNIQHITNQKVL